MSNVLRDEATVDLLEQYFLLINLIDGLNFIECVEKNPIPYPKEVFPLQFSLLLFTRSKSLLGSRRLMPYISSSNSSHALINVLRKFLYGLKALRHKSRFIKMTTK